MCGHWAPAYLFASLHVANNGGDRQLALPFGSRATLPADYALSFDRAHPLWPGLRIIVNSAVGLPTGLNSGRVRREPEDGQPVPAATRSVIARLTWVFKPSHTTRSGPVSWRSRRRRALACFGHCCGRFPLGGAVMPRPSMPSPRPFQDRFGGLNRDSWRVLRCDHERRGGREKVTKLR
jgi:hypothetical protein